MKEINELMEKLEETSKRSAEYLEFLRRTGEKNIDSNRSN
jgi:hypothetical protein